MEFKDDEDNYRGGGGSDLIDQVVGMMVSVYDDAPEQLDPEDDTDILGEAPTILAYVAKEILSPEGIRQMIRIIQNEGMDL